MQNLISNTLGASSFTILNKSLIKALGLHEAVILSFLVDKWAYFQHADFYYIIQDLANDTDLSERDCRNTLKRLMAKGILVKRGFYGLPPKQYYTIAQDKILNILQNPTSAKPTKDSTLTDSNPFKSDSHNPCKSDRVKTSKCASDILNNNKRNKNKEIITNTRANENQAELVSYTEQASKAEAIQQQRASLFSPLESDSHLNAQKHAFFNENDFNPSDHITQADLKHLNAFSTTLKDSSIASEIKRELGLFILMRKDLGSKGKLTPRSLQMILSKLESFKDTSTRKQALENSIINNWLGVFNSQARTQNKESNQHNSYERPKPSDDEISEFERIAKERALNPQYTLNKAKEADNDLPF